MTAYTLCRRATPCRDARARLSVYWLLSVVVVPYLLGAIVWLWYPTAWAAVVVLLVEGLLLALVPVPGAPRGWSRVQRGVMGTVGTVAAIPTWIFLWYCAYVVMIVVLLIFGLITGDVTSG